MQSVNPDPKTFIRETLKIPTGDTMFKYKDPLYPTWKKSLWLLEPAARKQFFNDVSKELGSDTSLTTDQLNLVVRVLQDMALSPRVTDLHSRKIYHRTVELHYPHVVLFEGTELLLKLFFPHETIYFLHSPYKLPEEIFTLKKRAWIVINPYETSHKIVMSFVPKDRSMVIFPRDTSINIFDSIGTRDDAEHQKCKDIFILTLRAIRSVLKQFSPAPTIGRFNHPRQFDPVNCDAFLVEDMRHAIDLMDQQIPPFKDNSAHPSFLKVSQNRHDFSHVDENNLRMDCKGDTKSNCQATLISLEIFDKIINDIVTFPPAQSTPSARSDSDEENCVIC